MKKPILNEEILKMRKMMGLNEDYDIDSQYEDGIMGDLPGETQEPEDEYDDELIEFDIPNWALSALINGDESGLSDEEQEKLNAFVNDVVSKYGNANFMLPDEDEIDLGFLRSNDIDNLGSDCSRLLIKPSEMNEAGFQGEPNFQAPAVGGDGVLENEDEDKDEDGMDIGLDMAAISHLSDIQEEYPELSGRINFIKALIMDMGCKVKTSTEKLDALYDKYNS